MPAAVAGSPFQDGAFVRNRMIGKARQGIVFGQDSDDRLPLSPRRLEGGGHARHPFLTENPCRSSSSANKAEERTSSIPSSAKPHMPLAISIIRSW